MFKKFKSIFFEHKLLAMHTQIKRKLSQKKSIFENKNLKKI